MLRQGMRWARHKRGRVVTFSRQSRSRCLEKMASVDARLAPDWAFVGLTYHDTWPSERECKGHLNRLRTAFYRRWGFMPVLWRLEWQARGAPHFHLLIAATLDDECFQLMRLWMATTWNDIAAPGDAQHFAVHLRREAFQRVRSHRGAMSYVSKYCAKLDEGAHDDAGRRWGVWRWDMIMGRLRTVAVSHQLAMRIRRAFWRLRGRRRGPAGAGSRYHGARAFVGWRDMRRLLGYLADEEQGRGPPSGYRLFDAVATMRAGAAGP